MRQVSTVLPLVLLTGCAARGPVAPPKQFDPSGSDPQALAVVDGMVQAMGGWQAWDDVAQLRWELVVDRGGITLKDVMHAWDRVEGRHTMEEYYKDQLVVVMQSVAQPWQGYVTVGLRKANADQSDPLLAEADNRFLADSYTLIAPFKLRDPGVHVHYVGAEPDPQDPTVMDDVIHVTFDPHTGETPQDEYWYRVSQKTHLVSRWEYILQGQIENNDTGAAIPHTAADWGQWQQVGSLYLSLKRGFVKGPIELHYKNVDASTDVQADLFVPYTTGLETAFGTGAPVLPSGTAVGDQGAMVVQ
jgi:hypothetical protein